MAAFVDEAMARERERNERSRAAILKLGAQFEGVLRNHRIRPDGSYRGSAVYSIIESEWASVKRGLALRLEDASAARAEQ